jgi:uncharacterized protein
MIKEVLNSSYSELSPVNSKNRIIFLDALRGLAILGILIMNIMMMGQPASFYYDMDLSKSITGANYYTWMYGSLFCEGAMRGLFSVLFGAGAVLLLQRIKNSSNNELSADIYSRRMLWLVGFGLLDGFVLLWTGDILYFYGLLGLILFPFRNMSPKRLLIPILILLCFGIYRESAPRIARHESIARGRAAENLSKKHQTLTKEQRADLENLQNMEKEQKAQDITKAAKETIASKTAADYAQLFNDAAAGSSWWESSFFYNNWFDMMIMFLVGMLMMKTGFITGQNSVLTYFLIAVFGLGLGMGYRYYELDIIYKARFNDIITAEHSLPIALNQIRRLFQVSGYISLLLLLYRLSPFRRLFNLLAPAGQMALTNYMMQSVIAAIIFYGFDYYGAFERYQLLQVALAIYICQLIFNMVWLKVFLFGPVEWLWRSLTYMKAQPMLRNAK